LYRQSVAECEMIWSVGHSNHSIERFIEILNESGIESVVDLRSQPYSRYTGHFNQIPLQRALETAGFEYVFLGNELGGRPTDKGMYDAEGHVLYGEMAKSELFNDGLGQLMAIAAKSSTAMMCSEEDPTDCHRRLLVTRVLEELPIPVTHIRGDASMITEQELAGQIEDKNPPQLFEEEEKPWRSVRSVLQSTPPNNSSNL
jgi:uncharacterized protein (DUF488 family)